MPLYDFACGDCGTKFERLVRRETRDIPGVDCPECGGQHVNSRTESAGRADQQRAVIADNGLRCRPTVRSVVVSAEGVTMTYADFGRRSGRH